MRMVKYTFSYMLLKDNLILRQYSNYESRFISKQGLNIDGYS
jgi:hypothetical protein